MRHLSHVDRQAYLRLPISTLIMLEMLRSASGSHLCQYAYHYFFFKGS
jgi:hypothetical protein